MISIVRRPNPQLTRAEFRQACLDLQALGIVHVHLLPSDTVDGAVVEVLRARQAPALVRAS